MSSLYFMGGFIFNQVSAWPWNAPIKTSQCLLIKRHLNSSQIHWTSWTHWTFCSPFPPYSQICAFLISWACYQGILPQDIRSCLYSNLPTLLHWLSSNAPQITVTENIVRWLKPVCWVKTCNPTCPAQVFQLRSASVASQEQDNGGM